MKDISFKEHFLIKKLYENRFTFRAMSDYLDIPLYKIWIYVQNQDFVRKNIDTFLKEEK